jgi:hypothetical protein
MKFILVLGSLLLLPTLSYSQTVCFRYQGGMVSCDGPHGQHSTQVPFTKDSGIISTEKSLEPYTIFPPADSSRSRPLDRAIRPLDPLEFKSRRDDPFRDPLFAPLLLGE